MCQIRSVEDIGQTMFFFYIQFSRGQRSKAAHRKSHLSGRGAFQCCYDINDHKYTLTPECLCMCDGGNDTFNMLTWPKRIWGFLKICPHASVVCVFTCTLQNTQSKNVFVAGLHAQLRPPHPAESVCPLMKQFGGLPMWNFFFFLFSILVHREKVNEFFRMTHQHTIETVPRPRSEIRTNLS